LVANSLLVENGTNEAEVTVAGATLLSVDGEEMQVLERGPRDGDPVVLLHCYACAMDWWDGMIPALAARNRVIAIDLLGFGGSEKPSSGYSMEEQADRVAGVLSALHVDEATVVGHSLGGTVTTALAERSPDLVSRAVLIDQAPDSSFESEGLPFTASLTFMLVLGPALWRITPDFAIADGLSVAFAPGYDVPDRFVEDFRRMTYTSYDAAPQAENDYSDEIPLDQRLRRARVPLLAIFGAEEQLYDPQRSLDAYAKLPRAKTALVEGAGHSPNVERPRQTNALIRRFMQEGVQNPKRVRSGP
jgi:pimeloyl-ACP methyl ester carboxylesterase